MPSSWPLPLFISGHWRAVRTYQPSSCLSCGWFESLKAGTVILISIPWVVHRNRHSDAYSLVGRSQRKPASGVQRVDMEKTFQAFGDSWKRSMLIFVVLKSLTELLKLPFLCPVQRLPYCGSLGRYKDLNPRYPRSHGKPQ